MGRKKKGDVLNPKEKAMVRDYVASSDLKVRGNATEAAVQNGIGRTRRSSAVLANHIVQSEPAKEMIERISSAAEEKAVFNRAKVLEELKRLVFFDPRSLFNDDGSPKPIKELDDETAMALAGIEVLEEWEGTGRDRVFVGYTKKYKLVDKLGAIDKAMKHLSMFKPETVELGKDTLEALVGGSWKKEGE